MVHVGMCEKTDEGHCIVGFVRDVAEDEDTVFAVDAPWLAYGVRTLGASDQGNKKRNKEGSQRRCEEIVLSHGLQHKPSQISNVLATNAGEGAILYGSEMFLQGECCR